MCTVTLTKNNDSGFVLTSNRDELIGRKTLPIASYQLKGKQLLFPKDEVAGGTWIAVSDDQHMVCLLNGGFKNHTKKNFYRHSRGVVVTDILSSDLPLYEAMKTYNCEDLEPFTLVAACWSQELNFYEMVWDGKKKFFKNLDTQKTHIWSSSTLYTSEMKKMREDWFADFKLNNTITSESIIDFHKNGGVGNGHYDLQIKRGDLQTRSITQINVSSTGVSMTYEDLIINEIFKETIETVNI